MKKLYPDLGNISVKYRKNFRKYDDIVVNGFRLYDCMGVWIRMGSSLHFCNYFL
jgi:hypothetical protein